MEMNLLPTGYRFSPTDMEIINLLKMKMVDHDSSVEPLIPEIDVLEFEPWDILSMLSRGSNDKKCYFFSPRKRKYPGSDRADRSTRAGHWKPTGKRPKILSLGIKRRLTFYQGRPNAKKTDYIMHQYELNDMKEFSLYCLKKNKEKANQELFSAPIQLHDEIGFSNRSSFDQDELHGQIILLGANQELLFSPSQMFGDIDFFEQGKLYDQLPDQEANQILPLHYLSQSSFDKGEPCDEDLDRLIDSFINNFPPESPIESDIIDETILTGYAIDGGEVINKEPTITGIPEP